MNDDRLLALMAAIVITVLLIVAFAVLDSALSSEEKTTAVVVERHYSERRSSSGVGVTGEGDILVTSSSSPEKFILIVDAGTMGVHSVTVSKSVYARAKPGDRLEVVFSIGRWTGSTTVSEVSP